MIGVRLQPEELAQLDAWIAEQPIELTRPAAIRRIMEKLWAKEKWDREINR